MEVSPNRRGGTPAHSSVTEAHGWWCGDPARSLPWRDVAEGEPTQYVYFGSRSPHAGSGYLSGPRADPSKSHASHAPHLFPLRRGLHALLLPQTYSTDVGLCSGSSFGSKDRSNDPVENTHSSFLRSVGLLWDESVLAAGRRRPLLPLMDPYATWRTHSHNWRTSRQDLGFSKGITLS